MIMGFSCKCLQITLTEVLVALSVLGIAQSTSRSSSGGLERRMGTGMTILSRRVSILLSKATGYQ